MARYAMNLLTSSLFHWRMARISAGAFAFGVLPNNDNYPEKLVIVGGDYKAPDAAAGTAVTVSRFEVPMLRAVSRSTTPPHGYRSSVAYDHATKTWITVGPNGTDISTDDGRNWRALHPDPKFNDSPDADQHWNALSLPYAVGPHGRIGKLNAKALAP